ncbi:MAG: M16 family metallopeptidase [Candidatus Methylomirabilia bacterium]
MGFARLVRRRGAAALLSAVLCGAFWLSAARAASAGEMADLESRVVEETLPNGMRVIVLPRHQSPTVALSMQFRVGAAQESEGASGLAHLLEHMMFKGTRTLGTRDWAAERPLLGRIETIVDELDAERRKGPAGDAARLAALEARLAGAQQEARALVVKDEIDAIYTANGSQDFNASTGVDVTTYKISLPANRLPLWARIESERLREPVMREFYSEREVVREERRQSYENDPSRKLMELLFASAFIAHPYRRPVIGWDGDVRFLRAPAAERFFRTWYAPNNTVLAAVGDVDPPAFLALVREAFGPIPAQPLPAETATPEPEQGGERRVTLVSEARPELMIGYHKPTLPAFEDYVFDLIDGLLTTGRTSRLYRRLVEEKQVAVSVSTVNGYPGGRYPNLFTIMATPRAPHTAAEVEAEIDAELARLAAEPAAPEEISRVKNQLRAGLIRGLQSNEGLASTLAYYETLAGDWRYLTTHLAKLETITPAEIQEVAAKYLRRENRTVAVIETRKEAPDAR